MINSICFIESVATGPDYIGAVPIEIELTPKKVFCSGSIDTILVSIGDSVMGKVSDMLMGLQELQTYTRTLLQTKQSKNYPAIRSNLNLYQTKLEDKEIKIKSELQKLLPAIKGRKDGKNEKDLMKILNEFNRSPFNKIKSTTFLDSRGLEIKALGLMMKDLDSSTQTNFEIADYKEPTKVALMMKYGKVVRFSVNILQSEQITKEFLRGSISTQGGFWYNDDEKASSLGNQKSLFTTFMAVNKDASKVGFLIEINLRNESQPFEVTVKEKGIKTGDFIIPDKPKTPNLLSYTDKQFKLSIENPKNNWITKFFVVYWKLVDGVKGGMKKEFIFSNTASTNVTIKGLTPLTIYQYKLVHFTEFGVSPSSEFNQVITSPCSEPINLKLGKVTANFLLVSWSMPVCGNAIQIDRFKVMLKGNLKILISYNIE